MDLGFHRTFDRHMDDLFLALKTGKQPPIHAIAGQRALLLAHAEIKVWKQDKNLAIIPTNR